MKYITEFSAIVKKYHESCKKSLAEYDFTPNETTMMVYMLKNPDVDTAKEIAQNLNISQSLICRATDSLLKKGFMDSEKDDFDRRINHLRLKIEDKQLRDILLSLDDDFEKCLIDGISDDDRVIFQKMIKRMKWNLGLTKEADKCVLH